MFENKITNLGVPTDAGDAASKSFVIKRVNKLSKDYALDDLKDGLKSLKGEVGKLVDKLVDEKELERVKADIGKTLVEKIREHLTKYIDEEKLEVELDKLKKEWALDDETAGDKITREIMKDIERGVKIL